MKMLSRLRFEIGERSPLLLRKEQVARSKPREDISILYVSDLHLTSRRAPRLAEQLCKTALENNPAAILLGGDLADRTSALPALEGLVRDLSSLAPVGAVAGNHDRLLGIDRVRSAVVTGGGRWLTDDAIELRGAQSLVTIIAELPEFHVHRDGNRDGSDRTFVLCAHNPTVFPRAQSAGVSLTLAGHLHGGQCVLATHKQKLYPGAFFSRWNGLRFEEGQSTMIVSRGAADTLPLRLNCPREVILCML